MIIRAKVARAFARVNLRLALIIIFGLMTAAGFLLAWRYHSSDTWLQIWVGVALSALTAGLVDFVGLLELRRAEAKHRDQFRSIEVLALLRARRQCGRLRSTVEVMFGTPLEESPTSQGDAIRKLGTVVVDPSAVDTRLYPFEQIGIRLQGLVHEIEQHQADLDAFLAAGAQVVELAAISKIATESVWIAIVKAVIIRAPTASRGDFATQAADMLDELASINIDPRSSNP